MLSISATKEALETEYTNYTFTIVPADFTVTRNEAGLTVSAANVEQTYDGTGYGVNASAGVQGATILYKDANGEYTLTESPKQTDVGSLTVEFKASLYGYADAYGTATVTIDKRPVTITAASAEKTYGEADPSFAPAIMSNQVAGELTDISLAVSRSDAGDDTVGKHEGVLSISATKEALEAAYTNYTFTIVPADFTVKVNPNGLTVSAENVNQVYDGTAYGVTPAANKTGATILYKDANGEYTLTESPTQKDVGEKTVEFKASLYGYADAYGSAKIKITPRPVTITATAASKVYGKPDPEFADATMTNQVAGELTDIDLTVSRSDAENNTVDVHHGVLSISATIEALEAAYPNYTFTIVPADFTISQNEADLTVRADDVSKVYDGNTYGVTASAGIEGATILYKDANGDYTLTESPKQKDVGSQTVEFKASLYGYKDAYGSAQLEVKQRKVTIVSGSDEKTYDGTPLTKHSVSVSGDGFVEGEGVDYTYTGSQTYVGSSENAFTYKEKEGTELSNYSITTEFGELVVNDGTSEHPVDQLVVSKTHDENKAYALGEEVTFRITVTNIYDTPMTIALEEKDGVTVNPEVFENVASGKTVSATAKYTITEQDILNGSFVNVVNAVFSKDKEVIKRFQATDTAETEKVNRQITVTKEVLPEYKKAVYELGDKIKYRIVATNNGNQTLKNVYVTDDLTQDSWYFTKLTPGQPTEALETKEYTVTEENILRGHVLNVATARADGGPEVTPGNQDVPTAQKTPSFFITKEADKTSNIKAGDVINYTITVTNNGNVTINDIEVKDNLTGDTFNKNVFNLIGSISLAPGEHREFTVRYTATQNDIVNGSILNVATVTGTDPDGNPVNDETERTVTTERANADYTVTKTVDNPKAEYKVGDVINYTIRVTNTGNLTLNNLTVADQMQGASGNAVIANRAGVTVKGNTATIATLAVGASIELKASYTVARADADGTLANRVNVTSTTKPGEDPENPNGPTTPSKSDETDPTPAEKTYVLTIHYVDNNGNAVAPDYTARLLAGETIDAVVSPAIDGYTPNFGTVVLPATGMPAANITVTVIYTPDGPDDVLDDPKKPNQPNNGGNNGGGNAVNNNNNNANNANNADNGNNAANNNAGQADANPAPADGVIQPDDNGGYDLTPVEDTPTPLANMNLDDHACCILHFLIMLLTLIIFALYTKSRKNRQLKVEELREQLAIASIQKELDLSDEDMAKYLEEAKKLAEEKKQANA